MKNKLIILLLLLTSCATTMVLNWGAIKFPTQDRPEAVGSYSAGCLAGGQELTEGVGYEVMRPSRQRFYGHLDLTKFIEGYALNYNLVTGRTLLIGDMAQPRGGPMRGGHTSHQSGLDVDIWFKTVNGAPLTRRDKENLSADFMVDGNGKINRKYWNDDKVAMLQMAAEAPEVERIFVNPSIKRELCKNHAGEGWLRKIRPWSAHKDHFHVRLYCPETSSDCRPQQPLPEGDGCDALYWWFGERPPQGEVTDEKPQAPVEKPQMPGRCESIYNQ